MGITAANVTEVFDWADDARRGLADALDELTAFRASLIENERSVLDRTPLIGMADAPRELHAAAIVLQELQKRLPPSAPEIRELMEYDIPASMAQFKCDGFYARSGMEACMQWLPELFRGLLSAMHWLRDSDNWTTATPPNWAGCPLSLGDFNKYLFSIQNALEQLEYITPDALQQVEFSLQTERRLVSGWLGRPGAVVESSGPPQDGPFGTDGFRWNGVEYNGLTPRPFQFVEKLWFAKDKTAHFDELANPEAGYHPEDITESTAGSWRRDANAFFKAHGIPWMTSLSRGRATMKQLSKEI